ncbi:MAG: ABC transporter ATP-binding protein [Deltaproteobacteria bacterium]|nr:ABC transporter ATP-binding protein [Deltaproteobacteria bacterium]
MHVERLHKRYEGIEAVAGLSFDIRAGEVFGLLGPNGAGKTTTISIVSTLLRATSGDAKVFGHSVHNDVASVRHLIGVVPQELALYPELTGLENLRFFGRMYGVPKDELERRIVRLLELVGLEGRRNDRVVTFSGGMKRRLNLAVSMVHQPKLILLDEPTVGVDPHSRENIFTIVEQLRDAGTAILYTTHYMEEAERLCNRLGIMDEGKIIALGSLDSLLAEAGCSEVIELHGLPAGMDLTSLHLGEHSCRIETRDDVVRLYVNNAVRMLGPLHQALGRYADTVSVEIAPMRLENLFLQLTGKDLRD